MSLFETWQQNRKIYCARIHLGHHNVISLKKIIAEVKNRNGEEYKNQRHCINCWCSEIREYSLVSLMTNHLKACVNSQIKMKKLLSRGLGKERILAEVIKEEQDKIVWSKCSLEMTILKYCWIHSITHSDYTSH